MTTYPNSRSSPKHIPFRIYVILLTLVVVLAAGGFFAWMISTSAAQRQAIESTAGENRAAVFQAASQPSGSGTSGAGPALRLDAHEVPVALVPGGPFEMGSSTGDGDELPVRTIQIDAFSIDVFEVTNRFYAECVADGGCRPPLRTSSQRRPEYYGNPEYADYPVINVEYEEAATYCAWRGGRLPTEAEWEKAAGGGLVGMVYPWGDEAPVCTPGAANGANFDQCSPADTWPVGSFAPNGYGLYDMAGNVWEWVADWYDIGYNAGAPASNPTGPETGSTRVLRGGAWNLIDWYMRVANRLKNYPVDSNLNIGFRCVQVP